MSDHWAGAGSDPAPVQVRTARLADPDDASLVSRLLADYLVATEREKGSRLGGASALPERYQREVLMPREELARCHVLLGLVQGRPAGIVVLTPAQQRRCELKRLWTIPESRGVGVADALLTAALDLARDRHDHEVRLSVWRWREGAIRLYERRGFREVPSWESRPELVCMSLALSPVA